MNKKLITIGIVCIIVVSAVSTFLLLKPFQPNRMFHDGNFFDQEHMFDKAKQELGLSQDSTINDIKISLGLSLDCSQEELMQALNDKNLINNNFGGRFK